MHGKVIFARRTIVAVLDVALATARRGAAVF